MRNTLVNLKVLVMQLINMEEEAGKLTVKDKMPDVVRLKEKMREHIKSCGEYMIFAEEIRKEIKEKRKLKNLPEEDENKNV